MLQIASRDFAFRRLIFALGVRSRSQHNRIEEYCILSESTIYTAMALEKKTLSESDLRLVILSN